MGNERIDLTQFENFELFEAVPWTITEDYQGVIVPANHESTMEMRLYTGSGTNSMAIAKVPELIAELKRCYEAIDVLSKSTIDDTMTIALLAKKLAKQNRDIEEIIDCLDGVDSIFGEEILGMLRPLLARF